MLPRRIITVVGIALTSLLVSAPSPHSAAPGALPRITVYKDPNCGCCTSWVDYLRKHGFDVVANDVSDMTEVKATGRVPQALQTCHTAFVGGYVIEGHVPAADIQRLLAEKPQIAGLAVPGMPIGSPGMEVGTRVEKYDVIAFSRDGSTRVFAHH